MKSPPLACPTAEIAPLRWDVFCRVIDNWGDAGFCWRLCADLAERRHTVRLWIDQPEPLHWIAPERPPGIQVHPWPAHGATLPATDVVLEAFGCGLDPATLAAMCQQTPAPLWINLEYLSAEAYVARSHGLPSPQANGLVRHFFFPGFSANTGGLLREPELLPRQRHFDATAWLRAQGIVRKANALISLFCYEPPALYKALQGLADLPGGCQLLVCAGRGAAAVQALQRHAPPMHGLHIHHLPLLSQPDYDHLLWTCDLNFVRGEDSLVRALWAGNPLIWQAYPQTDDAHHAKLQALIETLHLPNTQAQYHRVWNASIPGTLPTPDLPAWGANAQRLQEELSKQTDLSTRLIHWVWQARRKRSVKKNS